MYSLSNEHKYARLLAADGTSLTVTGSALDVNLASGSLAVDLSANDDSVLVYGNNGGSKVAIAVEGAGRVLCDSNLQISNTDLAFGQTTMNACLPVAIASDQPALEVNATSFDIRQLSSSDVVSAEISTFPVAGSQDNAWSNATVSSSDYSAAVDCTHAGNVSIFGINSTGNGMIRVFVSQDDVTYYETGVSINLTPGTSFYHSMQCGARFIKLQAGSNMTGLYATVAAKV